MLIILLECGIGKNLPSDANHWDVGNTIAHWPGSWGTCGFAVSPTNWVNISQRLPSLSVHWNHLAGEWREGFKNYWCVFLIPRDSDGADLGYGLGAGVCKRSLGEPNGRRTGNSCPKQILISPLSFLIYNMWTLSVYKTGSALPSTFLKMQANSFKWMIQHFLPERDCWTV